MLAGCGFLRLGWLNDLLRGYLGALVESLRKGVGRMGDNVRPSDCAFRGMLDIKYYIR